MNTNKNIQILKDLIYNKEYDEAKKILENNNERVFTIALRLINSMDKILEFYSIYQNDNLYISDINQPFKRFFESLKYKDYEEAYKLCLICANITKEQNPNDLEFDIYQYILEDILEAINTYKKEIRLDEIKIELDNNYYYKKFLTQEEIDIIEKLLKEKGKLEYNEYDNLALQLIEVIKQVQNEKLDVSYFEQFNYEDKDITEKFWLAMKQGDYLTAYKIIYNPYVVINKSLKIDSFIAKKNISLYKNLLYRFKINLYNKFDNQFNLNHDLEEVHSKKLLYLEKIKDLIAKKNYIEAYQYILSENLNNLDIDTKIEIEQLLKFLIETQIKDTYEYFCEYKKFYNMGDYKNAGLALSKYKKKISGTQFERNIDFHQLRIKSMRKEIRTEDFDKKEQLYMDATHNLRQCYYKKCIKLLDEYICLDNDLSNKGYFIRGKSYEALRNYEKAKQDYEKSISIIPEPSSFYRLGYILFINGEYKEALKNFLEYEKRKPCFNIKNIEYIIKIYKIYQDEENVKKYEKLRDYLSKPENPKMIQYKKI